MDWAYVQFSHHLTHRKHITSAQCSVIRILIVNAMDRIQHCIHCCRIKWEMRDIKSLGISFAEIVTVNDNDNHRIHILYTCYFYHEYQPSTMMRTLFNGFSTYTYNIHKYTQTKHPRYSLIQRTSLKIHKIKLNAFAVWCVWCLKFEKCVWFSFISSFTHFFTLWIENHLGMIVKNKHSLYKYTQNKKMNWWNLFWVQKRSQHV